MSSLIRSQGIGDLAKVYILARENDFGFHLAFIPDDFTVESAELFDPVYMKALFQVGYESARAGTPWRTIGD